MPAFSESLLREIRDLAFFRVLSGKNAMVYVDVLEALDRESEERPDGLAREEAIAMIAEILTDHPEFQPDTLTPEGEPTPAASFEDLEAISLTARDKARQVLDHLVRCRWLEEPPRRDWQRRVYFDAHSSTMMMALRKIAFPDAAVFTDKLLAVCALLFNEMEIIERPWQTVENCLSYARQGLNELRTMQKSVQRLTRRQLEEDTLKGNLEMVFDRYAEEVAHTCYAELVRARLPTRLPDAVRRIGERLMDSFDTMSAMQTEYLRRHDGMSAETARAKVRNALDELSRLLEMVLPMADEIDRRTADFTRRSLARFRYLQEVTGERRGEMREFFEQVNRMLKGRRFTGNWELEPELPPCRMPEAQIPAGRDSLYEPPQRRTALEQEAMADEELSDEDRDAGLRDMERALKESLSVRRANAFVADMPGGKGAAISSADLPWEETRSTADLLALILHAESPDARYRLETDRQVEETESPTLDPFPGGRVERFRLIKK
ncbi:Wadjet anti-phage system protein JetA family protein [Verrucomicrobium spinosum]|uniref:Wadjet anti-phage system protein JetA family protein n=1 Tax=Verrucomicrobium spinosum TaxID=2736 RepID=UPI000174504E|nr:Wadjet anti-phage system protein JetA family protein [Verrucomicrobium spinosum]